MSDTNTETVASPDAIDPSAPVIQGVPPHYSGTAIMRITAAVFKASKTQNPMLEIDQEIIIPEKVKSPFNGKVYALDGAKLRSWWLLWNIDKNGNVLQNGLDWLNETLLPKLSIEGGFVLDSAQPLSKSPLFHAEKNPTGIKLEGLIYEGVVKAEEDIEQRRKPDGTYEPLKDMRGNIIIKGWKWTSPSPAGIIRLAEVETGRAF